MLHSSIRLSLTAILAFSFVLFGCDTIVGGDDDIIYEVGEEGPAGGLIFYVDDDDRHDDFDYLEAAPDDGGPMVFLENPDWMPPTSGLLGDGPDNTSDILENPEMNPAAASYADALEVNGYDDWFLPSLQEMEAMNVTLHQEGLGGFQDAPYWTSTYQGEGAGSYWVVIENFDPEGELESTDARSTHLVRPARAGFID